ncbi:skin secretory protein xP2-like isoform X2 [Amphibalanus amphitrite]|uniref:skin secretory protein xP2-like isoform X2 n=1 Tax=Amphibalanus amphitrite TaxID=1232801 RepID=UPI001C908D1C|nr:skin secretory protein xP2-like isoform X2 [Amphibalanus amphitrite]
MAARLVVLGLLVAGCQCWKLPVVNQGRRAQYYTQQNDGSYSYGFDTAEGLYQAQEGDDVNEVRGKFGADGGSVEYTAGVNGYVVTSLKEPSAPSTRTYVSKTPVRYATLEELATHPEQVEDTAEVKAAKATFRATYDALAAAAEAAPDVNIITGPAPAAPVHSVTYSAPAPQQVYLAPAPVAIKYSGPAAPLDASGKVDDTAEVKAAKASFKAAYDAAAAAAAAAPDVNIITGAVPVATYSAPAPAPVAIKYQGPGAPLDASGNVDDTAEVKAAKATFRATYDALAAAAEAAPDVNIITGPAPAAPVHSVSYSAPAPHSAYLAPAPVTIKYSGPAAPLDASGNVDDTAEVKAAKATFKATYDALAAAAEAAPDVNIITGAVPAATYSAPAPAPVHSVTYSAPAPHSTYLAPAPVAIKYSGPAAPMDASGNVDDTAEVKAAKAAFRAAYDAAAAAAAAAPDDDIITSSGQVTSAGYSASSIPVVHSTYSASQGNMRTITFDGITLMVAEPYGSSKFGYSYE